MENRDGLIKTAIKLGSLIGGVQVLLTLLLYLMGIEYMTKWWVSIVVIILAITLLVIVGKKIRTENGGFISFGNLFVLLLIAYASSMFIATVFNILLYNVIDPNLAANMQEVVIENTTEMMEGFGMQDDQVEQAVAELENFSQQFTVGRQAVTFLWSIIWGAIISSILAAILKKNPNPFEEEL